MEMPKKSPILVMEDGIKFLEVLEAEGSDQWTVTQLFEAMIDAIPEKKETILSIPVHRTIDGEVHIELLSKDD